MNSLVAISRVLLVFSLAGCAEPQFRPLDSEADAAGPHKDRDAASQGSSYVDSAAAAGDDGAASACAGDHAGTPGHDCAGVVHCINVGPCDLSTHKCCMDFLGFDNACTTATSCGALMRSACDGPEDCDAGEACCIEGLLSLCVSKTECAEPQRACHTDADCEIGRCVHGAPYGGVLIAREWGFCRG